MPAQPRVSVILPTHNRAHLVGRAIRSAIGQSFEDLEVLVVDDGSSDDTEAVVRAIPDTRIRYLRREEQAGCSAARNFGMDAARGDHVAFLDSDDEWLPEKLERQLERLEMARDDVGIVVCGMILMGRGRLHFLPEERDDVHRLVLEHRYNIWCSSFLLSPIAVRSGIRFDEKLPAYSDWDFLLRLTGGFSVAVAPGMLAVKHSEPGPHVWSGRNIILASHMLLEKYHRELAGSPRGRMGIHRRIANASAFLGDYRAARRHFLMAIRALPSSSPGHYARLVALLLGPTVYRRAFGD